MLSPSTLPEYIHPTRWERGESFSLDFDDYRALCRCSLSLLRSLPGNHMAISKGDQSAVVDIWSGDGCYSIEVSSQTQTLRVYFASMDSPCLPILLYSGGTTSEDWRQLQHTVLA